MGKARIEIELSTRGATAVQNTLQRVLGGVKSWATGLGGALTAALSLRELVSGLRSAIDVIDKAGASAQRFGVSTQALSTLGYAAAISKSNAEGLEAGLRFLNRSLAEASQGSQALVDAFAMLGVQVIDAEGRLRRTDEVLLDMADRFAAMPNGAEKVGVAMQILGRGGAELIPLLNGGSQAIRDLVAEARVLGLEVTPQAAQAAGDFNDNLQRLQFAVRGFFMAVANEALPALVAFTTRLVEARTQATSLGTVADWLAGGLKGLAWFATAAVGALNLLGSALDIATDYLSIPLFAFQRFLGAFQTFTRAILEGTGNLVLTFLAFGEVLELVLDRRFAAAAARAKAIMGELGDASKQLVKQVGLGAAEGARAVADVATHAAEVHTAAREKLAAALEHAGDSLLAFEIRSRFPATPARTLFAFDPEAASDAGELGRKQARLELDAQAQKLADQRLALETQITRIEHDRRHSEAERYRSTLALRREEIGLIDDHLARLKERVAIEQDDATRQLLVQQIRTAEKDRAALGNQVFAQESKGDPLSLQNQIVVAVDDMARKIGTAAQQIARAFTEVVGGAITATTDGITDAILRTKSWGEAMAEVGRTITRSVIHAIVQMGVEFVATHVLMRGAMALTSALTSALGVKQKAENAQSFATGAVAGVGQAGAQGGWIGILIYLGVLAAAIGTVMAMAGGFAQGGPVSGPGTATSDSILARLSKGEYVLNAEAVRFYGQPMLDAINARSYASQSGGAPSPLPGHPRGPGDVSQGQQGASMSLILVDSRNQARQFLESAEGEARIVDIIRRHRMRVGIPT